jgi:lipid A 4'-phosphatase
MFWKTPRARGIVIIFALFLIGAVGTLVLDSINADLNWTSLFYSAGGDRGGWIYGRDFPWGFLYKYGEFIGLAVAVASAVFLAGSIRGKISRIYAKPCLIVILTVVLGPGLLVNGILKNYWGRPRPVEISQFGGDWEYRKVWEPGTPAKGRSFPCGHCSMAVSLASGVALFHIHPVIASGALFFGVVSGIVMGIARISQGGHFPTDVLWSEVLILVLVAALYYLVFRIPEQTESPTDHTFLDMSGPTKAYVLIPFVILPSLLCLLYWPVYRETRLLIEAPPTVRQVNVRVSPEWVNYNVELADSDTPPELKIVSRGYGFPWARFTEEILPRIDGQKLLIYYQTKTKGFLSHPKCDVTLWLPCRK